MIKWFYTCSTRRNETRSPFRHRFERRARHARTGVTDSAPAEDPGYALSGKADSNSDWCHQRYTSTEGTNLQVDYKIDASYTDTANVLSAQPLWLNVQRGDLGNAQAVHVWMGNITYSIPTGYDQSKKEGLLGTGPSSDLDLYRSDDPTRFTGQLSGGLQISENTPGDDEATGHAHEFAIVIDGTWQTDPISGTHNFFTDTLQAGCSF